MPNPLVDFCDVREKHYVKIDIVIPAKTAEDTRAWLTGRHPRWR